MSDFLPYTEWLEQLGWVERGDWIYVVSDMMELAKVYKAQGYRLSLDDILEKLQQLTGEEGTLLLPAFNWDFCKGIGYDYYRTPVKTGALPKAALKRGDFFRTAHPLYSFAVWGMGTEELMKNQSKDSFGPGTIFEKLYERQAKVLVIGLSPLAGITYIHHVEQLVGVPYRYNKEFEGDYTDQNGLCQRRTYRMYVRDLEMNPQHINGFQPLAVQMERDGMIKSKEYNTVPNHLVRIRDLDAAVKYDILQNDSANMYTFSGKPSI